MTEDKEYSFCKAYDRFDGDASEFNDLRGSIEGPLTYTMGLKNDDDAQKMLMLFNAMLDHQQKGNKVKYTYKIVK